MKITRDLAIYKPSLGYTLNALAGAAVICTPDGFFAIAMPTEYGASAHDATYCYFYVPADAIDQSEERP